VNRRGGVRASAPIFIPSNLRDVRVGWTPSRRGLLLAAAGAIAVLALGVGVAVAARDGGAPADREVVAEGVRLLVPGDWERNALRCGTPVRDTYIVGVSAEPLCLIRPAPKVDYVEVRRSDDLAGDPAAAVATSPATVTGHQVLRGGNRLADGRVQRVMVVPDRQVIVVAVSSKPAVADRIMRSVQVR
jgi:hypothetical protein